MSWKAGRPRILTASGPTMYWPAKICSSVDLPAGAQCGLRPARRVAAAPHQLEAHVIQGSQDQLSSSVMTGNISTRYKEHHCNNMCAKARSWMGNWSVMQCRQYVQEIKRCKCRNHEGWCTCDVGAQQEAAAALGSLYRCLGICSSA